MRPTANAQIAEASASTQGETPARVPSAADTVMPDAASSIGRISIADETLEHAKPGRKGARRGNEPEHRLVEQQAAADHQHHGGQAR